MKRLLRYLNKSFFKHVLFWIVVFSFFTTRERLYFDTVQELLTTNFIQVINQCITAYAILYYIIPNYRKRKNILKSLFFLMLLFVGVNLLYITEQKWLLGQKESCCYAIFLHEYGHLPFWERIYQYKSNFLNISWNFIQPLFFLVALQFYEKQQKLSELNEQKKIAELNALKHQLNPHFLFNTLNNLYALAVEKSDTTPEVIERLADMLDYMLYRCNDKFVSLQKEIELIENYLALEKIRYGKRVTITFNNKAKDDAKIAPLILLTFIENAFKHGVRQELQKAKIDISLALKNKDIVFSIYNTKPIISIENEHQKTEALGIKNVTKQLELLYPDAYNLKVKDEQDSYSITLTLKQQ